MPLAPRAVAFAVHAHRHQTRADGVTPYAAHVVRVALILATEFGVPDDEVLAAALLHDTIEDCAVDYDQLCESFGEHVASWVARLTKDTRLPEGPREADYLAAIAAGPWQVQAIKLADALDNLRDSASLSEARRVKTRQKVHELLVAVGPRPDPRLTRAVELLREALQDSRNSGGPE